MAQSFPCRHTCVACTYSASKLSDRGKHESARRPHRECREDTCNLYASLNAPKIRNLTPDSYSERLNARRATSESSTSSRKRSRVPTPEEDPEENLRREKLQRLNVMKRIKVCCILDPSRAIRRYEETVGDWCWVDARILGGAASVDEVVGCGDLAGYVFRDPTEPLSTVRINDWAYIAYFSLRQAGYVVEFKRWRELSELLTGRSPYSIAMELMEQGFDCIMGGIDLSIWAPYKDKSSTPQKQRDAFIALAKVFPIFPSPQGCSNHGAKVAFNETLELIANDMKTSRPKTKQLAHLEYPPYGFVLKREFSDASRDVFLPNLSAKSEAQEAKRAATFIRKCTSANKVVESSWLAQEYVPFLSVGEVRFVCVGGHPIREIVTGTHPKDHPHNPGALWAYERNDSLKTLLALQEVVDKGEELTEDNAFDPNQGTAEKDIARGKLYAFVTDFLDRLTALEGANSSLRVFCRVDVSVFVDEDKKVSFYVNEVERGLTTCLWSDQGTGLVGHVGTDLAWPLACWVLEEKRSMAL